MKQSGFLFLTAAVCMLFFAGCATAEQTAENAENKVAVGTIADVYTAAADMQGKIIGDTLLEALKTQKFELADSLKIGDSKNQLTREKFTSLCERIGKQGGVADYAYLGSLNMKPYRRLMWKVVLGAKTPGENPGGIDIVFEVVVGKIDNEIRAVGFGFRP